MSRFPLAFVRCLLWGVAAASAPRARDLGVPFDGTPGPLNAITDVAGVEVGQVTLIEDLANGQALHDKPVQQMSFIGNDHIEPLFEATAQTAEESIVNAMIAARDMQGDDGYYAKAISHPALIKLLKRFGRYQPPP